MHIPVRILRLQEEDRTGKRRDHTPREVELRQEILAAATTHMARHGRGAITLTNLAQAMRITPASIRRLFPDLHNLLGEILSRHLHQIALAIGNIPPGSNDRAAARRTAYLRATRGPFGDLTEAHRLLVRDRHMLPPDERDPIEATRDGIGALLAGELGHAALALLDLPEIDQAAVEAALATMPRQATPPPPPREPGAPRPQSPEEIPAYPLRLDDALRAKNDFITATATSAPTCPGGVPGEGPGAGAG